MGHDSGPALALLGPVKCFHSPVASSNCLRDRLDLGEMPRSRANFSHFVSCFCGGGGCFNV